MRRFVLAATLLSLVLPALVRDAPAQDAVDPVARSRELYREGVAFYQRLDYGGYQRLMEEAALLRPHHPTLLYKLAGARALSGDVKGSLEALNLLAEMGMKLNPAEDDDFLPLLGEPGFDEVLDRFAKNGRRVGKAEVSVTFEADDFIPESVAHDPVTGDFFIGSVHLRQIMRVKPDDTTELFADREDGLWSVMGLKVDAERRVLWACTTAAPQGKDTPKSEVGRTAVLRFDLDTGEVAKTYLLAEEGVIHWFGDLAVTPSGDVYITDSMTPRVYVIRQGEDRLEVLVENPGFASLQGITLSPDGERLFVADYSYGIYRVDPETGEVWLLPCPREATLLGIDGLYTHKKTLIAIQNGVQPHRVVRVRLGKHLDTVDKVEVLEANHPRFDEPTLGLVLGDEFFFVANSQWYRFDEEGGLDPESGAKGPVVLKMGL